jgi:hypothetical protein
MASNQKIPYIKRVRYRLKRHTDRLYMYDTISDTLIKSTYKDFENQLIHQCDQLNYEYQVYRIEVIEFLYGNDSINGHQTRLRL